MKVLKVSRKRSVKAIVEELELDENQKTTESVELRLLEAEILFDQQRTPVLVAQPYRGSSDKEVTPPPGPTWLGYFNATDDEVETLRKAGYTLADWRHVALPVFLVDQGLK
jgi:hypothetical protein